MALINCHSSVVFGNRGSKTLAGGYVLEGCLDIERQANSWGAPCYVDGLVDVGERITAR